MAWAITIHKSQGLTFERAIIDAQSAFAQKNATYIKLYNYLPALGNTEYLGLEEKRDIRVISLSSLGFSFHLENEYDRYREFEISRFHFFQEDNGTSFIETTSGSARYEYGAILKRRYNSIKVRLGGSARYYYGQRNTIVIDNIIQNVHGLIFSFTPHLDWRLHKQFYFELAPDIQLLNVSMRLEDNFQPVVIAIIIQTRNVSENANRISYPSR